MLNRSKGKLTWGCSSQGDKCPEPEQTPSSVRRHLSELSREHFPAAGMGKRSAFWFFLLSWEKILACSAGRVRARMDAGGRGAAWSWVVLVGSMGDVLALLALIRGILDGETLETLVYAWGSLRNL